MIPYASILFILELQWRFDFAAQPDLIKTFMHDKSLSPRTRVHKINGQKMLIKVQ